MIRAQIYLTEKENSAIDRLAHSLGHGKSELIRQAVDEFIARREPPADRLKTLRSGRGMWAGRKDIPNLERIRAHFNRF